MHGTHLSNPAQNFIVSSQNCLPSQVKIDETFDLCFARDKKYWE